MRHAIHFFIGFVLVVMTSAVSAAELDDSPPTVSGQWFLSYRSGEANNKPDSQFLLNRGYITIKKRLNDRISGRITPDISVDREGDGEGDLEMRLKYCYIDVDVPVFWLFTDAWVEFGLVHRPCLEYEQTVNRYRMQGSTFLARNGVISSADFGAVWFADLGGKLDEHYRETVNGKHAGRYGSVSLGIFNGGGYHAIEQNNNKTVEGRFTLRPMPDVFPGLQCTYHGAYGKGNTIEAPDWTMNVAHLTYECERGIVAGSYYAGDGDYRGKAVDTRGDSFGQSGYSLFGELKFSEGTYSLVGRYDYFDDQPDSDDDNRKRLIAGVAYHISGKTKILVDYDVVTRDSWSDNEEGFVQFNVEYGF